MANKTKSKGKGLSYEKAAKKYGSTTAEIKKILGVSGNTRNATLLTKGQRKALKKFFADPANIEKLRSKAKVKIQVKDPEEPETETVQVEVEEDQEVSLWDMTIPELAKKIFSKKGE